MSTSDGLSHLQRLVTRVELHARWSDLSFLPQSQLAVLQDVAARARQTIAGRPGGAGLRSRGFTALFTGPTGTGKTMAAEALASDLQSSLYRVNLAVVSKYIGETEKNLSRLFAAASRSDAILFFDEADALFGKRSEVRDSHDRYGNIELSYLLSRMEKVRGLTILAAKRKDHIDAAFLRRIRYRVDFPAGPGGNPHES